MNAVCPGTVATDLIPQHVMEDMFGGSEGLARYVAEETPFGRLQTPDELAAAICWLLLEDSSALTGTAINASAGQTMA